MKTRLMPLLLSATLGLFAVLVSTKALATPVIMEVDAQSSITYTAAANVVPSHGFMPVLARVENRAAEQRTWLVTFTYPQLPQTNLPLPGATNRIVLRERLTVPGMSTRETVFYVPTGGKRAGNPTLLVETRGPDVRTPLTAITSSNQLSPNSNYLAVSPALSAAINLLPEIKMRMVVYTGRDGSLQSRQVPPGSYGQYRLTNGSVVTVPDVGKPIVEHLTNATDPIDFKIAPSGDVTLLLPSGVFVVGAQTRVTGSPIPASTPAPGTPTTGRQVSVQLHNLPPTIHRVQTGGRGYFLFSNGTLISVPATGQPRIATQRAPGVDFSIGPGDNVAITAGPSIRLQSVNMQSGSAGIPQTTAKTFVPPFAKPSAPPVRLGSYTSTVDPARWPADPRVWSVFTLVILETQEWEQLDAARRGALRDWVAQGGVLALSPQSFEDRRSVEHHGAGQIIRLEKSVRDSSQSEILSLGMREDERHASPWQSVAPQLLTGDDWNSMQVKRDGTLILVFFLLFAIVAGPVTLFKLAPASRRQRIFLVVPALSLGTTALLGAVIVFRDGLGGTGIRSSLVLLLPEEKRAAIFQQQVARTGLLLRSNFELQPETLLVRDPVPDTHRTPGDVKSWTCIREESQANGDWFESRTCQLHQLRQLVSTRARVEILRTQGSDSLSVRSSLAGALSVFLFVDESGTRWTASNIAPGTLVKLSRLGSPKEIANLASRFPNPRTGWFYAVGAPSELAPIRTLPSIHWSRDEVLYAGTAGAIKEVAK